MPKEGKGRFLVRFAIVVLVVLLGIPFLASCSSGTRTNTEAKYPEKPIELTVPFSPGGGTDLAARAIASVAGKYVKQSIIVVQRPGAAGTIAHTEVAQKAPDGYSLIMTGMSPSTVVPNIEKVNYDPINDFEFIIHITNYRNAIGVGSGKPWKTVDELLDYAKKNPGKVKLGTAGANGIDDFIIRLINQKAGVNITPVPFDSTGDAITATVGGHVDGFVGSTTSARPMVESGKIRLLAIASDSRDPYFKDIPTLKEIGLDVSLNNFTGIAAPKGTPKEIVDYLHDAFKKTLEDEGFKALAKKLGFTIDYMNGEQFKEAVQKDSQVVKSVVGK